MSFHVPTLPLSDAGLVFAILFALVLVVPVLSRRARVPVVVGFVAAGMLVGPGVSGLLEREGPVELLGSAGLLYLMFIAGLELDLDEFIDNRRASLMFGGASFVIPMVLGTVGMLLLGFEMLAAVLLASCWASHTLVSYPEYQRYGTARNRAVSVTVGATILTDTAALIVLAVVAGLHRGEIGPSFWLTLIPAIVAIIVAALWVLPAVGRRFFSGLGQDTSARFLFVVTVMFAFSGLAEVAGIEGIVGAFLAGLAMNRLVAHGSGLMARLEFLGNQFFIPLFLISVGLLIDPRALLELRALFLGGAFTVIAVVAKALAAVLTGRWFDYERAETMSLFALSSAQAAATLAAILVGVEIGLIDPTTLNAVIAVIAVTCLLSSWLAQRSARQLPHPPSRTEVGATVVVPVVRPASASPLVRLAAAIARPDSGSVVPVMVVTEPSREELQRRAETMEDAERMALSHGVDAEGALRVDASPAAGIHHTVVERDASLMVVGWKGETRRRTAMFGGILDQIVANVDVPTVIGRMDDDEPERVVLAIPRVTTVPAARGSLLLAVEVVRRLVADVPRPVTIVAQHDAPDVREAAERVEGAGFQHDPRDVVTALRALTGPRDLVVLPVEPGAGRVSRLGARVARELPDNAMLIVVDAATRSVGELQHERLSTEHPFGPPPWVKRGAVT